MTQLILPKSYSQLEGLQKAAWVARHKGKIEESVKNAYAIMYKYFPKGTIGNLNGPGDAYRHCVWACLVRKTLGKEGYHNVVLDHENKSAYWAKGRWDPTSSPMDLANDEVGRKCANIKGKSCEQACLEALKRGRLYVLPKQHWRPD